MIIHNTSRYSSHLITLVRIDDVEKLALFAILSNIGKKQFGAFVGVTDKVTGSMRRDDGARMGPEGAIVYQWLGVCHVESDGFEASFCVQRLEDVLWRQSALLLL